MLQDAPKKTNFAASNPLLLVIARIDLVMLFNSRDPQVCLVYVDMLRPRFVPDDRRNPPLQFRYPPLRDDMLILHLRFPHVEYRKIFHGISPSAKPFQATKPKAGVGAAAGSSQAGRTAGGPSRTLVDAPCAFDYGKKMHECFWLSEFGLWMILGVLQLWNQKI